MLPQNIEESERWLIIRTLRGTSPLGNASISLITFFVFHLRTSAHSNGPFAKQGGRLLVPLLCCGVAVAAVTPWLWQIENCLARVPTPACLENAARRPVNTEQLAPKTVSVKTYEYENTKAILGNLRKKAVGSRDPA